MSSVFFPEEYILPFSGRMFVLLYNAFRIPYQGSWYVIPYQRMLTSEIEMPGMGSCLRSAKWAWDRPGGGYHIPLLGSQSLCLHTGLVRTTIGSLPPTSRCGDQGVVCGGCLQIDL